MIDVLTDIIPKKNTILLIVGESVGPDSAKCGHYYANIRNKFWELLSILIGKTLSPYDDTKVVEYGIGLTDIIKDKILLDNVNVEMTDIYFDKFIEKVKEIKPKIIIFNTMFSYNSKKLSKNEKDIRRKLKKRTEQFIKDYSDKYIIKQHISSSSTANAHDQKRKKQWEELARIYKQFY